MTNHREHRVGPRNDSRQIRIIWDVPLPLLVDIRPWVCHTCKRVHGQHLQWNITPKEVAVEVPPLLVHATKRHGVLWFTKSWLLFAAQDYYDHWCARSLRRSIGKHYSWNALTLLRLSRPLEHWLPLLRAPIQDAVAVYSGSIVRGDGNFKLGKKLASAKHKAWQDRFCRFCPSPLL